MCVQLINLIINFSALCFQLVQLFTQTVRRGVNQKLNRVLLFVMAIALHKLPEGIAAGVSMSPMQDGEVDWSVSFGIALQNIPEGMVIIARVTRSPVTLSYLAKYRTFGDSGCLVGIWIGHNLCSATPYATRLRRRRHAICHLR